MFLSLGILFCYLAYVLFISPILFPFDKEIKNYVKDNLIPIEGVDPNNLNFDDLIKLEQSIAESSVVFLGEQDHGDAATFLAKTRIIKFLHQKMGFNVLVFESDFYGVNQSWNLAKAGKASADEYRYNIYPHWTHCVECSELFKYIDSNFNTPNEITVAGVDPRHVMKYSRENFYNNFKKLVEEMELVQNTTDRTLFFEILREFLNNEYESNITIDRQEFFHSTIGAMSQRLDPNSFWSQELKNLNGFAFSSFESLPSNNSRDIQMADNLMWLLNNKYKGRKVIFWGSNSHIFKNYNEIEIYNKHLGINDTTNMGSRVQRLLNDDLYILGFTSHHGKAGRLYSEIYDVKKPFRHNFESWISETGLPYAFVDFRNSPFVGDINRKFYMKSLIHTPSLVNWFNLFDGVFYIEEMYPCANVHGIEAQR